MMPKSKKNSKSPKIGAIISDSVGNYEKHPYFVKKAEDAKVFIAAHGLPKELAKKQ